MVSRTNQPFQQTVLCSIGRKGLKSTKPLRRESTNRDLSHFGEFYCVDCRLRALRTKAAESQLAKALDRVLMA